jgi:CubicO group peptidase (beta-lactamase class C family)
MEHLFLKRILCLTLTIGGLLSVYSPVSADTQRSLPKTAQRLGFAPPGPTDPEELEAFFDAIMARQMESYHIPGGVIAVVKDGELVFSKGYGYANLEKRIPFQPEKSLVRIASITKLFTWTAVMQLEEQGKLDLNADVNTYLTAFKVPSTFPEPITILDLMDHTTGFDAQRGRNSAPGRVSGKTHAGACAPAGNNFRVFQLRGGSGGIHCDSSIRNALRTIYPREYPGSTLDDPDDGPGTTPGQPAWRFGCGLSIRQRQVRADFLLL